MQFLGFCDSCYSTMHLYLKPYERWLSLRCLCNWNIKIIEIRYINSPHTVRESVSVCNSTTFFLFLMDFCTAIVIIDRERNFPVSKRNIFLNTAIFFKLGKKILEIQFLPTTKKRRKNKIKKNFLYHKKFIKSCSLHLSAVKKGFSPKIIFYIITANTKLRQVNIQGKAWLLTVFNQCLIVLW